MNQQKTIIIGIIAILILASVGSLYFLNKPTQSVTQRDAPVEQPLPEKSATWNETPENVAVPEKGSAAPENVALPTVVGAAAPNVSAAYREFSLTVAGGKFSPDTVIVRKNDTVRITLTASGGDYDFTQPDYGIYLPVLRGQTKWAEFQATAVGKFTFYCKSCGGPDRGPVGYFIVAAQ